MYEYNIGKVYSIILNINLKKKKGHMLDKPFESLFGYI